jgi:type II secretory pathway component GspD/PulD (secretin)
MRRPRRLLSALLVLGACVGLGLKTEALASAGERPGQPETGPAKQAKQKSPAPDGTAQPGAKGARLAGPPFLKVHSVPGHAEALAKFLQQIYQKAADVKITALNKNTLAVWAGPEDQLTIARDLASALEPLRPVTEVIPLMNLNPSQIKGLLFTQGGPFMELDPARNALIVRGTREQIEEVRATLRALAGPAKTPTAQPRIIPVEQGSAATLAQALKEYLEKMRANPVRVVLPGQKEAPPPKPAKDRSKLPGKSDAPITITQVGNRLVVTSNDPEALALAEELVRLLTEARHGDDFEIIALRYASAIAVARTLDEAFNGPPSSGLPKQPFGPARPRADRVRIVADPATNSLLVKASPLDTLTIRSLVHKALDLPASEEPAAVLRPWVIGPLKHAKAADVTKIIQTLYREAASTGKLAIAVDERTNSLILRTSPALFEDLRTTVRLLEDLPEQKK